MHLPVEVCALTSSATCASDIAARCLVWPHSSTRAACGDRPLKGNKVNTLIYFIIAHFVGTDTLSDIQANMTQCNIRLGYFAFKLKSR